MDGSINNSDAGFMQNYIESLQILSSLVWWQEVSDCVRGKAYFA